MSSQNKYESYLSQAEKACKNKKDTYSDIAKKLFLIQKDIFTLEEKEKKKDKEYLLENRELSDFLNCILNESEVLMTLIQKNKKFKKEVVMLLLDDVIDYIMFLKDKNININSHNIPLPNLTDFMFGTRHNFSIPTPILYNSSSENINKIKDIIIFKKNNYIFNIDEITNNDDIKNEFNNLMKKYYSPSKRN